MPKAKNLVFPDDPTKFGNYAHLTIKYPRKDAEDHASRYKTVMVSINKTCSLKSLRDMLFEHRIGSRYWCCYHGSARAEGLLAGAVTKKIRFTVIRR